MATKKTRSSKTTQQQAEQDDKWAQVDANGVPFDDKHFDGMQNDEFVQSDGIGYDDETPGWAGHESEYDSPFGVNLEGEPDTGDDEPAPKISAADLKAQRDALDAQLKAARQTERDAKKAEREARVNKSIETVIAEEKAAVASWMIGKIVARVNARVKAGESRTDALHGVMNTLTTAVLAELMVREIKATEKKA